MIAPSRWIVLLVLILWPLSPSRASQGQGSPRSRSLPDTTTTADSAAADSGIALQGITPHDSAAILVIQDDTLFALRARLGPFSPAERIEGISARIRRLATVEIDSVLVVPGEGADELLAGDVVLMTVTEADARAAGLPRAELSRHYAARLTDGFRRGSMAALIRVAAVGAAWALLATLTLGLVLWLISRLRTRIQAAITAGREGKIPALKIQRLELLSSAQAADALSAFVNGIRIVVSLILLYFWLTLVLRFFPWTRPIADRIVHHVLVPVTKIFQAVAGYIPNLIIIVVIVLATRYALKLIWLIFGAIQQGRISFANFDREWALPTYKIVRFLVFAFVAVILFPYLPGAASPAFKSISLFLGALFTLGSSSAVSNVVAGVVLTYTRAFRVGDRVQIGETTGDVIAKTLLVSRLRTIKNVDITVPNALVLGSHIVNYSAMATKTGVLLHTTVTIGYDVPWRKVHELLIAAASATGGIQEAPAPFVLQTSLDDFYVSYQLNASIVEPARMATIYSELHQHIQDQFKEGGVEIMSPHYRATRDGNETTIPSA